MNYLLSVIQDQFYVFKKSTTQLIIKWGLSFENGVLATVVDLDTELWWAWQVLVNNETNYIHVQDWVILITEVYDPLLYTICEVDVALSWNIDDIRNKKPFTLKWITWDSWLQGIQGIQGIPGDPGNDWIDWTQLLHWAADPTTRWVWGDFYINTTTNTLFGPKALDVWPAGIDIKWDDWAPWDDWTNWLDGWIGVTWLQLLNWLDDPTNEWVDWDFYLNTTTHTMFGPKASWVWPAWVELKSDIQVWTVTTWAAWTDVIITNSWTDQNPIFDITIPKGDTWAIGEAPEWEEAVVSDNIVPDLWAGWTSVLDYPNKITVTEPYGKYTIYTLTTITSYDDTGTILPPTQTGLDWAWDVWNTSITYTNATVTEVESTSWTTTFDWNIAYKNQANVFTQVNTFNWTLVINGPAVFGLFWNPLNTRTLDITNWSKQYVEWNSTGALGMSEVVNWATLLFVVDNTSGWPLAISLWTFSRVWTGTYIPYSIGWTTYPFDMPIWLNFFVAEVFSTWIHITHAWVSVAV
jgi:hypothetical protein